MYAFCLFLGSYHGRGTYFAINPLLSRKYGDGLLLVHVLTGIYTESSGPDKPNLSTIPQSKSERIHSVIDSVKNPTLFVISNDDSAYPEYILCLKSQ